MNSIEPLSNRQLAGRPALRPGNTDFTHIGAPTRGDAQNDEPGKGRRMLRKLLHLLATVTLILTFVHQLPRSTQDDLGERATEVIERALDTGTMVVRFISDEARRAD